MICVLVVLKIDMCLNSRWIKNPYTGDTLFVKCGHCEACQMEKSKKNLSRILNHEADHDYYRLFITLTYSNDYVPYVSLSDFDLSGNTIDIRRMYNTYEVKNRYGTRRYRVLAVDPVDTIELDDKIKMRYFDFNQLDSLSSLQEFPQPNCVGVLWHDDFTRFVKRFKIYMKRYYNIDLNHEYKMHYYKVGEYGPTTFRPHFHAILYFPADFAKYYGALKRAIIKAWPFCHPNEWKTNIKIAYSGQSYVSKYTVRPSEYPDFLTINRISQKPTFSRGYGFGRDAFSADKIYDNVKRKIYTFSYQSPDENGAYSSRTASIPTYVYNRYFPKFKGFYRLDSSQIFSILVAPQRIYDYKSTLQYTSEDFTAFHRLYYRAVSYYPDAVFNPFDYALTYVTFYQYHPLFQERILLSSVIDPYQFYDNNLDVINKRVRFIYEPSLGDIFDPSRLVADPNTFSYRVQQDAQLHQEFDEFKKKSKINDICYNADSHIINYHYKPKLKFYG